MIKVVVLVLSVMCTATIDNPLPPHNKLVAGTTLYEWRGHDIDMPTYDTGGKVDRVERCRKDGIAAAKELTKNWRALTGSDFVYTNVDCHWDEVPGERA